MLGECPFCSPSGKPSGMQAGIKPPKYRKERAMREGERENSTKGKGIDCSFGRTYYALCKTKVYQVGPTIFLRFISKTQCFSQTLSSK